MVQQELTPLTGSGSHQAENQLCLAIGMGSGVWAASPPQDLGGSPGGKRDSPLNADEPGAARTQASHHRANVSENDANTREVRPRGEGGGMAVFELLGPALPPLIHESINPSYGFNQPMVVSVMYNLESQRSHLGTFRNKTCVYRSRNCSIR